MAFVGQAIASTIMSYQMLGMMNMSSALDKEVSTELNSDSSPQNMMSMMDHSMHNMSGTSSDSDESSNQDCCNKNCQCYTGGCSNVASIINSLAPNLFILNPEKILNTSSVALSQQSTSLYLSLIHI